MAELRREIRFQGVPDILLQRVSAEELYSPESVHERLAAALAVFAILPDHPDAERRLMFELLTRVFPGFQETKPGQRAAISKSRTPHLQLFEMVTKLQQESPIRLTSRAIWRNRKHRTYLISMSTLLSADMKEGAFATAVSRAAKEVAKAKIRALARMAAERTLLRLHQKALPNDDAA